MKQFNSVDFRVYSDKLDEQISEIHGSRTLNRAQKQMALVELGLKKEDLRILYGGMYYNPTAPFRITTPRGGVYTFGVEIECFVPQYRIQDTANSNNVRIAYESYNHTDNTTHYKFVHDGSVLGDNAIECVSPILKGNKGMSSLKAACKALNEAGATVNRTCGLHVHIGAKNMTNKQISNVYKNYQKLETVIDSFLAPSRRNNSYAKSLRGLRFDSCETPYDIASYMGSRYYKVNPEAYRRHYTIEFRQHQGTTNYEKISKWIKFLMKLCDWSKENVLANEITNISDIPFLNDAEKRFFEGRKAEIEASNA